MGHHGAMWETKAVYMGHYVCMCYNISVIVTIATINTIPIIG